MSQEPRHTRGIDGQATIEHEEHYQSGLVGPARAVLTPAVRSGDRTVTGHVTSLEGDVLTITTQPGVTIAVRLVGETRYLKWVTTKPMLHDTKAERSLLGLGKLVTVGAHAGEAPPEARMVRIAVE